MGTALDPTYSQNDVQCQLNGEADIIQIRIENHGIGIPISDQPHIYDVFSGAAMG
jgi:signal transduction histidine kinase